MILVFVSASTEFGSDQKAVIHINGTSQRNAWGRALLEKQKNEDDPLAKGVCAKSVAKAGHVAGAVLPGGAGAGLLRWETLARERTVETIGLPNPGEQCDQYRATICVDSTTSAYACCCTSHSTGHVGTVSYGVSAQVASPMSCKSWHRGCVR